MYKACVVVINFEVVRLAPGYTFVVAKKLFTEEVRPTECQGHINL
jgi:hypothetical protein